MEEGETASAKTLDDAGAIGVPVRLLLCVWHPPS